jgi:hypothetical protein
LAAGLLSVVGMGAPTAAASTVARKTGPTEGLANGALELVMHLQIVEHQRHSRCTWGVKRALLRAKGHDQSEIARLKVLFDMVQPCWIFQKTYGGDSVHKYLPFRWATVGAFELRADFLLFVYKISCRFERKRRSLQQAQLI